MAKRRNLKKEKALRNEAYARKFRKRPNKGGRFGRRRFESDNRSGAEEDGMQEGGRGASDGAADL